MRKLSGGAATGSLFLAFLWVGAGSGARQSGDKMCTAPGAQPTAGRT